MMKKLGLLARTLFDSDTKALIEVGVLERDLSVSKNMRGFVLAFLVNKFKKELAEEAKALLKEREEAEGK